MLEAKIYVCILISLFPLKIYPMNEAQLTIQQNTTNVSCVPFSVAWLFPLSLFFPTPLPPCLLVSFFLAIWHMYACTRDSFLFSQSRCSPSLNPPCERKLNNSASAETATLLTLFGSHPGTPKIS